MSPKDDAYSVRVYSTITGLPDVTVRLITLFTNAGVIEITDIENATEKAFDYVMDINFKGSYFTLSKFIPSHISGWFSSLILF